ncbi:MAG TPA: uroporphyrinogen decarboxylase family protein, partial [Anaerohalosphaeraceae bacterium]|nr:uroporphyrinogen decarboxylase family protein [Anaerohalosphaeraceae bacterium]
DKTVRHCTSRQRLIDTLNHRQPDRLCVDFGAGGQTGMGAGAVYRLRRALIGQSDYRVKIIEPFQMLGEIDQQLRNVLRLDVAGFNPPTNMFGFRDEGWKPFDMPDGTPVLVPEKFNYTVDADGGILMYPQGDTSVAPCAKMPAAGYFFDALNRQQPFREEDLDPADNCQEFGLLSDEDVQYFADTASNLYDHTEYGIYMTLPGTAFGDIALVPATFMKNPRGIRDVEEWYISTALRRDYIYKVFETQCAFAVQNIQRLAHAVGDKVQVVFVSGTDFGTQRGLFISKQTYRELFKPFHKAVNDTIHRLTSWKTFIHSCGAVFELIPDFIEAGFDILNPVQCSAEGMDPKVLKNEFGKQIVFWGGGVDTQKTLPFGTPDEVYRQVRERIDIFAEGGGFVFNSIHNVQSNVPTENLLAMFRAIDDARA